MNAPTSGEELVERLVQVSARGPDPNVVAAAAGGPRGTSDAAHLARDPEAVMLLRALARERARKRRVVWGGAGLAACLLAGVVFGLVRSRPGDRTSSLAMRLEAAVLALRSNDHARFEGLALARVEDLEGATGVLRGGAAWMAPRGLLLEPPQELRWRRAGGIGRAEVTLKGPGVDWQQVVEADSVAAPPLGSGRYVVTLRVLDGLAGQTVRRSFVISDPEQRRAYAEARAAWVAQTHRDLHDLIEAHYALAHGWLERALEATRRADAIGGEARALARPLLRHLER